MPGSFPAVNPYLAIAELGKMKNHFVEGAKKLHSIKESDVHIATTEKHIVFQQDKVSLYQYQSLAKNTVNTPVIIVYGLIGRFTMADLQEDRSLIRNLLNSGVDVYAVDWGTPTRADRWLTLDDYINGYLHDCIEFIKRSQKINKVNILGICEGGVFSIAYTALHSENIKNLMTTITPVDFHGDVRDDKKAHGYINLWTRNLEPENIDRMIEVYGNMPGEFMALIFQLITPIKSLTKYNIDLLDIAHDEKKLMNFLRMEKWLSDRPDHPGEAAKEWFINLYQKNQLINNELVLGNHTVNLKNITAPILNIFAKNDHIIPPECSKALQQYTSSKDYTDIELPGGHVGVFVSGKSQGILGKSILNWLQERD